MVWGIVFTLTTLYIIGVYQRQKPIKEGVEEQPINKPLEDIEEYNIYEEYKQEKSMFDGFEMDTFANLNICQQNAALMAVMERYEQSGIELPLELYVGAKHLTTEKEIIHYLEIMRKNMAKNLNMKLVTEIKSAAQSKKDR